jgi:hypothetical protein
MERVKRSKLAHYANKLAVESEPNLTTAQLMLYNHDLKPVCKSETAPISRTNSCQGRT